MAIPKYEESTTWLGMRGRDAVRKSTVKVNFLQVFTIDFSEIQFIVNHNSQSEGQHKSAKSGMNLHKKTIQNISLQRKRKDTKDNGILLWTKQAKMGLWNFDLILEPQSWSKIVDTTNQENKLKSVSIQINTDDSIHLHARRGGTSLNGIGIELNNFLIAWISFCYSWFRLQSIAIHCNRREVLTDTPHTRLFLEHFDFVHTSHCGSRCRSVCLTKSPMHMSSHV